MKILNKKPSRRKTMSRTFLVSAAMMLLVVLGNFEAKAQNLPTAAKTQSMLRQTILGFAEAIEAEDFTDFHAGASADFQATFTPAQLKTAFQGFIDKKAQVVPTLRTIGAKRARFTRGPLIRTEKNYKILVADGVFPTVPYKTHFQMEYEWTGSKWELLAVKIRM